MTALATKDNPIAFCEEILGFVPHDGGQREAIESFMNYNILTLSCGRKWGKSLLMAAIITWWAVTKPRNKVFTVAPSVRQAKIIWQKVLDYLQTTKLKLLIKKYVEFPFPRIDLVNGSSIHAFGANSDQFMRGEEAHLVIVDEAAFVRDRTITDVIEPMMLVTGGKLVLISTPFGRNLFYQYFKKGQDESQNRYKSHKFSSVKNPYHNKEFMADQKDNSSRLKWQTEYEAEFMENEFAVFAWSDVEACLEQFPHRNKNGDCRYPVYPHLDHSYVVGVDWARVNDYTVGAVLDVTKEPYVLSHHYRNNRISWAHLKDDIRDLITKYNAPACMDSTSLGSNIVDEFMDLDVTGYAMSNDTKKYELIQKLARSFEYHRLALPDIPELLDELKYFEFSLTANNRIKTEAKRGHDDWVIALALANNIASNPSDIAWFSGVELGEPA